MEHNPNGINETEFIEVLGNEDDFVQILGVTPPSDGNEIDVSSVGFDEGDSFLIDIDDISQIDEVEGQDMPDMNNDVFADDSIDDSAEIVQGDVI